MSLRMYLTVFSLVAACIVAGPARAQHIDTGPSFDCAKAGNSIQLMICSDAELAEWDARIGQAYRLRLARIVGDGRRDLVETQRQWIESRNVQCHQTQLAAAKSCVLQMTKARVAELQRDTAPSPSLPPASIIAPETRVAEKPSQNWIQCAAKDGAPPELQIRGCTTVIEAGQETSENIAIAFSNRGNAYQAEGDYDRAVIDYDQAIQLNPNDPIAFSNRGNAYKRKGDIDHAIADFSEAIRLNPKFAEAFANRGLLKLKRGDADANQDLATAKSIRPVLARELSQQEALITNPPTKLESVPLPRPRATASPAPSIQAHKRQPCASDQVCP
jgi:tetratricopeptide (TPR) repeat protein